MKKRRILSLFLAATLAASSMPIISLAADETSALADNVGIDLNINNWKVNGTESVELVDDVLDTANGTTGEADSNEYITLSHLLHNQARATFTNPGTAKLQAGKKYTFSVWLRKNHTVGNDNKPTARIGVNGAEINTSDRFPLTEEWTKFTQDFTPSSGGAIKIQFWRFWTSADNAPYDIDGISIVDENGKELVSDYMNMANWSSAGYADWLRITTNEETPYYHADGSTVTPESETLAPGFYTISGDFRIGEYDYNKLVMNSNGYDVSADNNKASLSASSNGSALKTPDGKTAVELLTYDWTSASFVFVAKTEFDLADLEFKINGANALDFKNIKIEANDEYTTEWETNTGEPVKNVNDFLDTEAETIGTAASNDYITIYRLYNNLAKVTYTDNNTTKLSTSKTYEFSIWLRKNRDINESGDMKVRIAVNGNEIAGDARIPITEEWTKYTKTFTPSSNGAITVNIWRFWTANDIIPFDIDGMSIVDTATGEELITTGTWTTSGYANPLAIKLGSSETSYTHADGAEIYATSGKLEQGIYYLSGDFRLGAYDHNKFTVNSSGIVTADANGGTLTVTANGKTLKTVGGAESLELSPLDWTSGKFILVVDKEGLDLTDLIYNVSGVESLDFKNIKFELADDFTMAWESNTGDPVSVVNDVLDTENGTVGAENNEYTHITNVFTEPAQNNFIADNGLTLDTSKTYKLSVWMRGLRTSNAPGAMNVRVFVGGTVEASREGYALSRQGNFDFGAVLSDKWQQYTMIFKPTSTSAEFGFRRYWTSADVVPFDIDGISLVEVDPTTYDVIGEELITTGYWTPTAYPTPATRSKAVAMTESEYFHVEGTGFNATSGTLGAGIYHVTGDFRLGEFDFDKVDFSTALAYNVTSDYNYGILTATANGTALKTTDGKAAVELNAENWTSAEFLLKVGEEGLDLTELEFVLSEKISGYAPDAIDFRNIKFTEATKMYLDNWTAGDGTPIMEVNAVLDTNNETVGEAMSNTYISVFNRSRDVAGAAYSDKAVNLEEGKSYKLSLWMKTPEIENFVAPNDTAGKLIRIALDDYAYSSDVVSSNAGTTPAIIREGSFEGVSALLSDKWQKYTMVFTENETEPLFIRFRGGPSGYDYLPFDVDGLSLVEVELDGNGGYTVIGEELIHYGEKLSSNAGWSSYTYYENGPMTANVALAEEFPYYTVNAPLDGSNTEIIYSDPDPIVLEPGIYNISGKFRLGSYDMSGENNSANLTMFATANNVQLLSVSGSEYATVSSDWNEITFVLDTSVTITMEDFEIMLDGAYNIDFTEITVELVERHIKLADINTGYIMTLLLLKKLYAPAEDTDFSNLIYDAITNVKLRHWEYGDQTLEQLTDEDGNMYLSASNLSDNITGFTYTPGTTLKYGTYRFSGEFRTKNPGEKTNLRINISGKQGSVIATNEWTKFEFFVELAKDAPLIVKVYGGPILTNTQDFEMRNFRLDDLAANPIAQTLYSITFDKDVSGWSTGGQGAGTFTWKTEENGNGYMTVSDRATSATPAYYTVPLKLIPKSTYVFSFDVRATNPGETSRVRFGIGYSMFTLDAPSDPAAPNLVMITSGEWMHVTATYVANGNESLAMLFMTGPTEGENIEFDIDNFKIERMIGVRYEIYPAGDFDNQSTALIGWGTGGQGAGKITWQQEENGNGYIQLTDRANALVPLYRDFGFKTEAGKKYKISYDIKTVNEGETMVVRTSVGYSLINTQYGTPAFTVNNNWQHIESYYTAETAGGFTLMFRGGPSGLDTNDFAIDNLVIEEVE